LGHTALPFGRARENDQADRINCVLAVCDFAHGTSAHSRLYRFKFATARIAAVTEGNKYHRRAMRCVRTAERMRDAGERAKLLEIARAYLSLARHVADRQEHATVHRAGDYDPRLLEDA
jgi:hypothetical protein